MTRTALAVYRDWNETAKAVWSPLSAWDTLLKQGVNENPATNWSVATTSGTTQILCYLTVHGLDARASTYSRQNRRLYRHRSAYRRKSDAQSSSRAGGSRNQIQTQRFAG